MKYVALLRGVNVGGKGTVDMAGLKSAFETAGMTQVATYINSGNVIFGTDILDRGRLTELLEGAIEERFGFRVDVLCLQAHDRAQLQHDAKGVRALGARGDLSGG
jgi:uncharacterized protein (DUF1697 family)